MLVLVVLELDGRYLRVDRQGSGRAVVDADTAAEAEVLRRVDLGHDRVALETRDGHYLTMLPDPGQSFGLYPRPKLSPAAAFKEVLWPTGEVSLRSHERTFVAVDGPDHVVTVNRVETPLNARFTYARPSGVVPSQRRSGAPALSRRGRAPRAPHPARPHGARLG